MATVEFHADTWDFGFTLWLDGVGFQGAPGDFNLDGSVDAADAAIMFGNWGSAGRGDLNEDGFVDAADAGMLFANWTGDGRHDK